MKAYCYERLSFSFVRNNYSSVKGYENVIGNVFNDFSIFFVSAAVSVVDVLFSIICIKLRYKSNSSKKKRGAND